MSPAPPPASGSFSDPAPQAEAPPEGHGAEHRSAGRRGRAGRALVIAVLSAAGLVGGAMAADAALPHLLPEQETMVPTEPMAPLDRLSAAVGSARDAALPPADGEGAQGALDDDAAVLPEGYTAASCTALGAFLDGAGAALMVPTDAEPDARPDLSRAATAAEALAEAGPAASAEAYGALAAALEAGGAPLDEAAAASIGERLVADGDACRQQLAQDRDSLR